MLIGIFQACLSKHTLSMAEKNSLRITVARTHTHTHTCPYTGKRPNGNTLCSLAHRGGFAHGDELNKEWTNFCNVVMLLLK